MDIYRMMLLTHWALLLLFQRCLSLDSLDYLTKYGYLPPSDGQSGNLLSEDYVKEAVSKFQKLAGLTVTGELDAATRDMMYLPRCGVKDPPGADTRTRKRRRRRFALHGSKWSKPIITYRISEPSKKLSPADMHRELQRAFEIWSNVIPLKFKHKMYGPVDIEIQFVSGHHRDNTPFDGNGQTLAHAYFPQYGGDAHFDEDERWTVDNADGVNLFQVAAHEFGHSLGLAHSEVRTALMAPFYRGYDRNFKLDEDDILAVQKLYGTFEHTTPTPVKPIDTMSYEKIKLICRNASIDAVTRTDDGVTYIFQGDKYYRLNERGIDDGYPRLIHWDWGTVTGPIDAALTWPNGWTFIYKGNHYWKFHNLVMVYGPKNISEGFDGIPSNLDTAFVWSGNGKTYFIKDNKYWRYYGNRVDYGYPKPLSIWRGLPGRIDAAFQYKNERTYFFSGDQYYRYNDQSFNVDEGNYPREIGNWWLGCPTLRQIKEMDRQNRAFRKNKDRGPFDALNGQSRDDDEQWITIPDIEYNGSLQQSWNAGVTSSKPSEHIPYHLLTYFICARALAWIGHR